MVASIIYFQILGLPLIIWGGIITLLLLMFVGLAGTMILSGSPIVTIKTHALLAYLAIFLALIHGLLALLAFLGI